MPWEVSRINLFSLYAKISLDDAEYKKKLDESKKLTEKFSFDIGKAWETAKKGATIAVGAVTAVVGGLAAASAATEEYRLAQGKLNTAFEAAGYSADTAKQVYSDFYSILGDVDTATEASQLLAKLAENEQDMTTWTRAAAGVWGTFGDSLPIESLIEAANETAKTGTVVGTLADALNWAGINEDDFNEQLKAAGSESERNRLIMETLSSTYDTAADSFYKNNEQIIKNREQQAKLTEAMASVGDAVDKVKGAFVERFMPAISDAAEKVAKWLDGMDVNAVIDTAIEKITEIKDLFIDLLPAIVGVATAIVTFRTIMTISAIIDTVTKAITAFKLANDAAKLSQAALNAVMNLNPFVLIATLIAGVVAVLITLWNTNEGFRNAVIKIWTAIQNKFQQAWEFIKNIWDSVSPYFSAVWENVKAVLDSAVEAFIAGFQTAQQIAGIVADFLVDKFQKAWESIKAVWDFVEPFFSALWAGIKAVFSVVSDVLGSYFSLAWKNIQAVWNVVTSYFQTIFNSITGIFSAISAVLRGDFQAAWDAIVDVFSGWCDFFEGLFDTIVDVFGNTAKTFTDIGKKIVQGIKDGISSAWDGLVDWFNNLWDDLFGGRNVDVDVDVNEERSSRSYDGSHRTGLAYVPFDGYIAELHQGERVLTAEEAKDYRSEPQGVTIIQNIYSQAKTAADEQREARQQFERAVLLGNV